MTVQKLIRATEAYDLTDDPIEQMALIICELWNKLPDEVDNFSKGKFLIYSRKVARVLKNVNKPPLFQYYSFETDAEKITFGQFIEVQAWLKMGEYNSLPLIAASILHNRTDHKRDAERMANANSRQVVFKVRSFLVSFEALLKSYSKLFELDEELDEEAEKHPFVEQYGWIFSAKQVAVHEGITLDQAFDLPVLQALNDLAYLKSEQAYQKKMMK